MLYPGYVPADVKCFRPNAQLRFQWSSWELLWRWEVLPLSSDVIFTLHSVSCRPAACVTQDDLYGQCSLSFSVILSHVIVSVSYRTKMALY